MPYDSLIDRTGAEATIPEEATASIIQNVPQMSSVLTLATKLPNMASNQTRMPVIGSLPVAYFVSGDNGLKQTSNVTWDNIYLNAEELAVIVPIPENVLDDAGYDIWAQIKPHIEAAFGKAIDQAILYGTNAPASWPDDILAAATAASHVVDYSTQLGAGQDLYDMILGEGGVVALVEEDGYMVSGHVAALSLRAKLRGLRGSDDHPVFATNPQELFRYSLDGEPVLFPKNGALDSAASLLFSGDWSQLVYALRQDITYKMLDQAVITDPGGNILINLAQQDMVALRCKMRLGWALPNPINAVNPTAATRYPFGVLKP